MMQNDINNIAVELRHYLHDAGSSCAPRHTLASEPRVTLSIDARRYHIYYISAVMAMCALSIRRFVPAALRLFHCFRPLLRLKVRYGHG